VRFHIYTVIYGGRLAFVPEDPVEFTEIPVVAESIVADGKFNVDPLTPPGVPTLTACALQALLV
jgi:hypothetical protein